MGIASSLGIGIPAHHDALKKNSSGIKPLSLFPASPGNNFPTGEIPGLGEAVDLPRTHTLAITAAREALAGRDIIPDAIIIGTTTGGMPRTEVLLKNGEKDSGPYRYHSTSSVAEYCADVFRCEGLVITVTTACSSGTAAIILAFELLRSGRARRVLAGGADALCRLTYYGFNSLQLIDPAGSRPLDRSRRGMTVAEGSAMLLLEAAESRPVGAIAEILGGGLSCDAYHPAAPHPQGDGALAAMKSAIGNAGISASDIEYINLHGTGTLDNDLAEARAVRALFGDAIPPLSSVKGATGHSLAAAGAIEAVISSIVIGEGLIPANTGCVEPDPELKLKPVLQPLHKKISTVLSNSFGFGGNNACLVLSKPGAARERPALQHSFRFEVLGSTCITGAGDMDTTLRNLQVGKSCRGALPLADISKKLPAREVRRLKRLPRIVLSMAMEARELAGAGITISSIFFGTGLGPLSETGDFLSKLFESNEQFVSPTDFVGSVHNAPAGQAAIWLKATGANITATGGDYSFEQALYAASLTAAYGEVLLLMGADEHHDTLSPLFDGSVRASREHSDGGGALCLRAAESPAGIGMAPLFFGNARVNSSAVDSLVQSLGGPERINASYAALFAGIPAGERSAGDKQLHEFLNISAFTGPVIDYRSFIGEFPSASAAAAAIAARLAREGAIPEALAGGTECSLGGKGILLLGLGSFITAIEITAGPL
ncbi:MAG: hypothetical protein A2176_02095 [Spirochaetes bacterium RBG_13_51_14]|nr:MAG: hypothetical protein A2176_02095 [Spirochaetes bacterium RBG_13_51_14]